MGAGKTTWAINLINNSPNMQFVYVTPLLEQIYRIKKSCPDVEIKDPPPVNGRKINGLNKYLYEGKNIAVTHSTFANADEDTLQYIQNGNYVLILDEVLDILIGFNDVASTKIRRGDPQLMIDKGLISVDHYGRVSWVGKEYEGSTFADVKRLADKGHLYYLDESLLVWQFPAEIFAAFKTVYIMTYLFDGSFLKPYFLYHDIPYELKTLDNNQIVPYHPATTEQLQHIASLIDLDTDKKRNNYQGYSCSKNWYRKPEYRSEVQGLQKNISNLIRNIYKAKAKQIMWTAFDDGADYKIKSKLIGDGYRRITLTQEEESEITSNPVLTADEKQKAIKRAKSPYVANNCRATNEYRQRDVCVYALNLFCNQYIKRFFENRNEIDGKSITVNEDLFSLSCMLQWIWRSAIRDDKPIKLYVPSTRMRELLIRWLHGDFICDANHS